MKPYYNQDGVTIYCGDAREIVPWLAPVESIITDPVWPGCELSVKRLAQSVMQFEEAMA